MRLKIKVAYVGTRYSGWQRQPDAPTVQGLLEAAAARVAGEPVAVSGASRTDAGVHAEGQVAHLDVPPRLTPADWLRALNAHLPEDVRVVDSSAVAPDFHARFGARRKHYRYRIDERAVASPFLAPLAWHVPGPLDLEAMDEAAHHLEGDLDQRGFATQPDGPDRPRPLERVTILRNETEGTLAIDVIGRSFLRYAVRGMVGTLVEVGRGRRAAASLAQLAAAGDRDAAGATAPAHGLCLVSIEYEEARD